LGPMRWTRAPAKINLTLRVIGRRADGYHELESLVAFAGLCDWVAFEPAHKSALEVLGPSALEAGPLDDNLVLRAHRALAALVPGLSPGRFRLVKRLPAAAGLGGGSADAAAALRLLADEAGLSADDPRVRAAATATGADVLACLCPHARMMTGIGDRLGPTIALPKLFALLVNPKVEAPTPKVFAALGLARGANLGSSSQPFDPLKHDGTALLDFLSSSRNDLEAAAVRIAPAIAQVRERLSRVAGVAATGMSGSGATCFALFGDRRSATVARRVVSAEHPDWWVEATAIR
jgi:4-diphosphocytidyl-2-C-methyl-D-erythritol kinase